MRLVIWQVFGQAKVKVQCQFQATWLYGLVEPATGKNFFYEFSHLNTDWYWFR